MNLKKIPFDPAPPPISDRPHCPMCNKPLRPIINVKTERENLNIENHGTSGFHYKIVARTWAGQYHGYGNFCMLRCAADFANAAYKAGYKLIKFIPKE